MKELLKLCSLVLLVLVGLNAGISQTVSLGCIEEDDSSIVVGLDRKNWNGGSTADHSEGYLINFTLPSNTFGDCKKITEVQITVNIFSVDLSSLPADCSVGDYWTNIYSQCSSTAPASCPTSDIIDEFPNGDPLNISGVYTYTCPADAEFPFDDVVAFDIVPAVTTGCTNGQSMISTDQIIIDFEVCVEVTIGDDAIESTPDLGLDKNVCSGGTEILDAGIYDSYLWAPNGQTTQMITEGIGTYTVTVSDDNGCTASDEITINEIPLSVVITSTDSDNFICDTEMVTLSATSTATTFDWSNGDSGSPIDVGPGTYTVTVTDTDGCAATDEITINAFINPVVSVNPASTSICDENPANIQATAGFASYDWGNGNGPVADDNADLTSGAYVLTITDLNGCTATADINVSNVTPPNPGTDNSLSACNNSDTYNIDDYLGPHDSGGTWSENSGSNSGVDINIDPLNTSFEDVPPGVYEFDYTVTGTSPCADESATITITVEYFPNAGVDNFETVCNNGGTLDFDLLIGPHDNGGTWTEDNGSNSGVDLITDIQNVSFLGVPPGTYNYTYLIIGGTPCPDASANLQIVVNSGAQAGMDNTVSICGGSSYDLTSALSGMADLGGTWFDTDMTGQLFGSLFNSNGFDGQTINFTYLVGVGGSCGTDEATITVEIQDNLSAGDNSLGNSVCTIDTLDLFDYLPDADMGGDFNDLNNSGGLEDNLLITENITPGTYQYEYTIGDGFTCAEDDAIIEITFQEAPSVILSVNGGNSFCEETCSILEIEFTGSPSYNFMIDVFNSDGISQTLSADTLASNIEVVVCNDGGDGTITNDTLHIGSSFSEWYLSPSSFNDANCTLDLNTPGVTDTILFQIANTYISNINPTLCVGESIMVNNQVYDFNNQSGEETVLNPGDCDSTYVIDLSFYPPADSLITEEFCSDQDIIVNGTTYNQNNPVGEEILIGLSQNGCDSTVTINLTFFDSYDLNETESICEGESILLGGAMQTTSGTYVDMELTQNGCDSIVTTVLNVLPCTVPIDLQIVNNECVGAAEGQIGISLDGGDFPITVNWTGNGLMGSIILNQISTFGYITDLESEDYTITILDVNGQNLGTIPLSIIDNNMALSGDIDVLSAISCFGEMNGSLEADITGGGGNYTYDWDMVTGNAAIINNLGPATYNLLVTDQFDCTLALSQELLDPTEITYSLSFTDISCGDMDGGNMILENLMGGTESFTVTLDGNIITAPYEIDNLSAGAHQLIISDSNNCMLMESFNIIMEGGITFDAATTDSACPEASNGSISVTNINGGTGPFTVTLNGTIITDPTLIPNLASDTYTVIVRDVNDCSMEQIVVIGELPEIAFDLASTDNPCAAASDGTISVDNITGGTAPYVVTLNGSLVTDPSQITNLVSDTYTIVVTDMNNCSAESIRTITDLPSPDLLDYELSYTITEGETITLDGNFLSTIDLIEWTGEASLSCTDCQNPTVSPVSDETYTLTVFDLNGCSETISIGVTVNEVLEEDSKLYIPNVFSPNGDGINDTFDLGSDADTNITVLSYIIYDRWGNIIVDTPIQPGTGNGWNGLFKNKEVNPGVFTYLIRYASPNTESTLITGQFTLMK